jgi:hypothetical protein
MVGAAVATADPGPPAPPPPPPPPPTTGDSSGSGSGGGGSGGGGGGSTSTTTTPPPDTTPPKRVRDLRVTAPEPGRIVLSWTLVHPADVAHVIVVRGRAGNCPTDPLQNTQIGGFDPRAHQVDAAEHDRTRYCYAVFTLDAAGNWAPPVTHRGRNQGDLVPPAAVTGVHAVFGKRGAVRLTWTNPPDAARTLVVRGFNSACPHVPSDGDRVGGRALRHSVVDAAVQPGKAYCYAVYAFDQAGNRSDLATAKVEPAAPTPPTTASGAAPPSQPGPSSFRLPDIVGLVGGGALVLAAFAYLAVRLARREWEWHTRTGYGIRDLMSIDVRDYDRTALVIPALIGVCIAGAVVVLLMSL